MILYCLQLHIAIFKEYRKNIKLLKWFKYCNCYNNNEIDRQYDVSVILFKSLKVHRPDLSTKNVLE